MILTQCKDTNDIENTQIYFHEIYENTQIYIEKSFENTQIWMFSRYYVGDRMIWNLFYLRSFGHGNFWLKSLKVLRCNVYNTSLYNKKMGFGLTTHPINPHIYENLYAI